MRPIIRRPAAIDPTNGDQTANHANSTSPSSATLSNTAAGYATLGGRWQFAAVASAATDFALFAYLIPAGYRLFITGVTIHTVNTGAAVATTAHIFDWSLGLKSTAVSLATAALRRITLGIQALLSGAAIGAVAEPLVRTFDPPLVAEPGEYVHLILQMPLATNTGSQVIRGDAQIHGYFEPV